MAPDGVSPQTSLIDTLGIRKERKFHSFFEIIETFLNEQVIFFER